MLDPNLGKHIDISISLPWKRREYGDLGEFVSSMFENADERDKIELIIRVDSVFHVDDIYYPAGSNTKIIVGPNNYGSRHLEELHNEIAKVASGDYLMVAADDITMLTKGWDTILKEKLDKDTIQVGQISGKVSYPVVTRYWVDLFGCLAESTVDAWIHYVARGICEVYIPEIQIDQNMDDNADDERNDINAQISVEFHSTTVQEDIKGRRKVLQWTLEGIGQDQVLEHLLLQRHLMRRGIMDE